MIGLIYRAADALRRRGLSGDHGRVGEDLAHRYLRRRGCTIVARNYRPRFGAGELDLVAWHGESLVFVEVKTRATAEFGEPDRAVDAAKRRHLQYAAREYARRAGVEWEKVRFDIVSVVLSKPVRIAWLRDAFSRDRR
ncbi:MAG: YraN family protein [Acidobacteriia bacterium]|nr:YraN family protein [Terriglobia bacterium]